MILLTKVIIQQKYFYSFFSWRSIDETDPRTKGWVHGLHLPLPEPLLLPGGFWSYATQSNQSLQVGHAVAVYQKQITFEVNFKDNFNIIC